MIALNQYALVKDVIKVLPKKAPLITSGAMPDLGDAAVTQQQINDVAKELLEIRRLKDYLETLEKVAINTLMAVGPGLRVTVAEYSDTVAYMNGADKTEISATDLWRDLFDQGRMEDFAKVVSVTGTALKKNLPDGAALEAKHKKVTGKNADSIKIAAATKEDLGFAV